MGNEITNTEIDILLATYNGGRYLAEFLDSLSSQEGVFINLYVSDDGSTDETLSILDSYRDRFRSLVIFAGPQQGAGANFMSLLPHSKADFAAFADQDDLWNSNHLKLSIDRLQGHQSIPRLTYSSVEKFYTSGTPPTVSPTYSHLPNFERMYVECYARGCTMVMNREAVILLKTHQSIGAIMHDWWALLAVRSCGDVVYESRPEIRYRVHSTNTSPQGKRSSKVTLKKVRTKEWIQYRQMIAFYEAYEEVLPLDSKLKVRQFIESMEGPLRIRLRRLVFTRFRYRTSLYDELRTRIGFLIFPFLFNTRKRSPRI